jgi:hypothetical protein
LFNLTRPSGPGAIAVYTTTVNPTSLVEGYVKTLSRDWQLDALTTAQAKSLADGLLCFRRGDRYCLIWVEPTSAHLLIQVERLAVGRRAVTSICEVVGIEEEDGIVIIEEIYKIRRHKKKGRLAQTRAAFTGFVPTFINE